MKNGSQNQQLTRILRDIQTVFEINVFMCFSVALLAVATLEGLSEDQMVTESLVKTLHGLDVKPAGSE